MRTTKSPGAVAALGASQTDELGRRVVSENSLHQHITQAPIYGQLIGVDRCEAEGIVTRGSAPVLTLCCELMASGHDPKQSLRVYRGEVLALTVRSVAEGARLRIASHGVGFERLPECTGASPVRENCVDRYPLSPRSRAPAAAAMTVIPISAPIKNATSKEAKPPDEAAF